MTGSFDGNDGNDGNAANAGGGGNATSASGGWFFADRINLPFVTVLDSTPTPPSTIAPDQQISALRVNLPNFPDRNWAAEWFAWVALNDFAASSGFPAAITATDLLPRTWAQSQAWPGSWTALNGGADVRGELDDLVTAAQDERADALAEILSQNDEFISYFLNAMTARPGAYPATTRVLTIASMIGTFVAMHFKIFFSRPRPSQLCPALLPPIEVPGHASLPSGHSTQAHLMAWCMVDVLTGASRTTQNPPLAASAPQAPSLIDVLWTLADRIARNREIAGLHYPSDTAAGVKLAKLVHPLLGAASQTRYRAALALAQAEWP
jgi:membrane-associated phospholipid phosphatase